MFATTRRRISCISTTAPENSRKMPACAAVPLINDGHVQFHPQETPVRQLPLILMNRQGASFDRIYLGDASYLDVPHLGRGLAIGDLDNDGDYDLGFTCNDEPSALLRNDSTDGN